MMDYINCTPLVDPIVNWVNTAPFEPSKQTREAFFTQTRLAPSKKSEPFELFASVAGTTALTVVPGARIEEITKQSSLVSELVVKPNPYASMGNQGADIDRIAKQRVKLMAAKYASSAVSAEIVARLEILNRRLLDSAPRVSKEQVEGLENANERLASIRAAREERAKRLGITA